MILFTAEPLRFFIYISVCCWTFELSLLLNLWDYLLLLNLWIFFTAEPLRLSVAAEPLDFLYCWTFENMLWIMYLFTAEPLDFIYCWTFEIICLLLNLWIFFTAEPLDFFYCWTFEIMPRDIHIECSKQFKWNLYFYVSGQSGSFWAVLKLLLTSNRKFNRLTHIQFNVLGRVGPFGQAKTALKFKYEIWIG